MLVKNLSSYKVTIVSFCGQDEVVTSWSMAVLVWKELLQDVMLAVPGPFERTVVDILSELGHSKITVAMRAKPKSNTSTDECFDTLFAIMLTYKYCASQHPLQGFAARST